MLAGGACANQGAKDGVGEALVVIAAAGTTHGRGLRSIGRQSGGDQCCLKEASMPLVDIQPAE